MRDCEWEWADHSQSRIDPCSTLWYSLKYSLIFPQDKTVVPVLDWDKTGTTENWDTSILRYANTSPITTFSALAVVHVVHVKLSVLRVSLANTLASLAGHSAYLLSALEAMQRRCVNRFVSVIGAIAGGEGSFFVNIRYHIQQRDTMRLLSKQYPLSAPQTVTQQARYEERNTLSLSIELRNQTRHDSADRAQRVR